MTVLEAIQRSTGFLEKKGVESPRLNAELLLAHALRVPRMRLYLAFERILTNDETEALRASVVRRGQREPLQHITGTTSFCGYDIAVDRRVLVPRPETEVLAEAAFEFLASSPSKEAGGLSVLDIATGSGCLAIAIALKFPKTIVTALDMSSAALEMAAANVKQHDLESRVTLLRSDLFHELPAGQQFNLMISNPPYIPTGEIESLAPEVRDFDPCSALDGGIDGLDFYRRIAAEGIPWLAPGGTLIVEFGDGQAPALEKIFSNQNWVVEPPREDYTRRQRILAAHRTRPAPP